MTNGRLAKGIPTRLFASGPEIPSVAGTNLSFPPSAVHSLSVSLTKAPVAYAVGVKVVPRLYTSGPCPDTTEVWILVSSSLAEANVSHLTSAPVWALNFADVESNQAFCSAGN